MKPVGSVATLRHGPGRCRPRASLPSVIAVDREGVADDQLPHGRPLPVWYCAELAISPAGRCRKFWRSSPHRLKDSPVQVSSLSGPGTRRGIRPAIPEGPAMLSPFPVALRRTGVRFLGIPFASGTWGRPTIAGSPSLSPVQPTDLRPILHLQHPAIIRGGSTFTRKQRISIQTEPTLR